MGLRIIAGPEVREAEGRSGLRPLVATRTLRIEGGADVRVLQQDAATCLLLIGTIVGQRIASELLQPLGALDALTAFLLERDPAEWRRRLDGPYILVRIGADGVCDISADRFGQRDLYVASVGRLPNGSRSSLSSASVGARTYITTDLNLLPVGAATYDQAALAHTLCVYGYRPPKRHTLHRGVRRVAVEQSVRIRDGKTEFRDHPVDPLATRPYGEPDHERYADLLLDAIKRRGSPDGNVVYLSSGWDSTALLACLVHLFGRSAVRAVIGRMQYAGRSGVINQFEIDRAKHVADYFKVRLEIVELDYRTRGPDLLERWGGLLRGQQITSLSVLNHLLLAEGAAKRGRSGEVVFAGEISDGAHNLGFSQFVTIFHPVLEFREYSDKMASYCFGPTFMDLLINGRGLEDPVYQLLRSRLGQAHFDPLAGGVEATTRQLLAGFFLRGTRLPLWSLRNNRLLTDEGRRAYVEEMEAQYLAPIVPAVSGQTLYAWYLQLYNSFHWQSSTVASFALTAEAHGLQPALPFWDSQVQDFLAAMPESWGRGLELRPTKYPLKRMLQHRIDYPYHLQVGPHSYLYDVDPGFSHSAEILYGSAFTPWFRSILKQRAYRSVLDKQLFDLAYLDGLVENYGQGTELRGAPMSDLMALCLLSMVDWHQPAAPSATANAADVIAA